MSRSIMKYSRKLALIILIVPVLLCVCTSCKKSRQPGKIDEVTSQITETSTASASVSDYENKRLNVKPNILIGIEYALPSMAETYSELEIPAVKYFPDEFCWDKMQVSDNSKIDFTKMDRYVKEYQDAGFTDLVLALKTKSKWASKDAFTNFAPKLEYEGLFSEWVREVVERYDSDGENDMPGLKLPVKRLEIGVEFSSYEPEPAEDYVSMLELAYEAAHSASDHVIVLHAAFLTGMAFVTHPGPGRYEAAFLSVDKRIMFHSLDDIRKILDRPDIFDAVNFHALNYPSEIEDTVEWLKYEMESRGYMKPIVISDTAVAPFLGYGTALITKGSPSRLAIVSPPAGEKDRERLKAYFLDLIGGDKASLQWVHAFCAADMVKKVVIAAEQGVMLINTAFMEEFEPAKSMLFGAAAGNASWSGMALTTVKAFSNERVFLELRPSFHAIRQLASRLKDYEDVIRIETQDDDMRIYKVTKDDGWFCIAWYEPDFLVLPGDDVPVRETEIKGFGAEAVIEDMISSEGQTEAVFSRIKTADGAVRLGLTYLPCYISSVSEE